VKKAGLVVFLLYLSEVLNKAHFSAEIRWCKAFGPPAFTASMRKILFKILLVSDLMTKPLGSVNEEPAQH
jgi:hypothetical protein